MILRNLHQKRSGYAIIIVLILLVIGTATLLMLNRQSTFFSKLSGFFSRNRKIQEQAQTALELGINDLRKIADNSLNVNASGIDKFTSLVVGNAYNEGLYADYAGGGIARTLAPRSLFSGNSSVLTNGDIEVRVYYFPEDPCAGACANDAAYNIKMPKQFYVVSEALNTRSGEIFTVESHVKVRQGNIAEFAMGVHGTVCLDAIPPANPDNCSKPFPDTNYLDYAPAAYGRTHFDLDPLKLRFTFEGNTPLENPSQMHIFHDLVTFQNPKDSSQPIYPFDRLKETFSGKTKAAMMKFEEGWADNQQLFAKPFKPDGSANPDYRPLDDPSHEDYFTQTLQPLADASGYNLVTNKGLSCPATANAFGVKQIDICLKFDGTVMKEYPCAKKNDDFMGRVDMTMHPDSVNGTGAFFDPGTTPATLQNGQYDRYVNEHTDVYTGTNSATTLGSTNGVVYCYMSGCDCNIHVKGIVDGQLTVAANNIVIEGDLQYQNQDPLLSKNTLGLIAKNNVVIPAGVPQAATSEATQETNWQNDTPNVDQAPPFNDSTPGGNPATLAESYLGITNFIPQSGGSYVDRDVGNDEYGQYVNWNPTGKEYYNSPMALDIDGFIYAGNSVKVDSIFNPEMTSDGSFAMGFITCEDPPNCTNFKYRNPAAVSTETNALYKSDGTIVDATTAGSVQPLFFADGLNTNGMNIDWQSGKPKYGNYNSQFDPGEEIARPLNRLLNVFGGITSRYYYIFDQMGDATSKSNFRMGFRRKLVMGDPRASFLFPPGYPTIRKIIAEKDYQKSFQGKSSLMP